MNFTSSYICMIISILYMNIIWYLMYLQYILIFTITTCIYIYKFYLQIFHHVTSNIPKFKIFCTNSIIYKNK